ncbi:MAG: hypothetical protein WCA46_19490, partial [Actinocatenispora sp.]
MSRETTFETQHTPSRDDRGESSFFESAFATGTGSSAPVRGPKPASAGRRPVKVAPTTPWRRWEWARPVRPTQREVRHVEASGEADAPPVLFVPDLRDQGGAAALEPWLAAAARRGHPAYAVSP